MADKVWRIAERRIESDGVKLTLVRHASAADPQAGDADGGAALVSGSLPALAADVVMLDVPGDGDVVRTAPLRLIAAAGSAAAWRGGDAWWVSGAGTEPEPLGRLAGAAAMGVIDHPLASAASWLIDWANMVEVTLAHDAMVLANVSMAALVAGGNLAMIGGEAVQFMRATPLGARRWRIGGLLRGRGGTGAPVGGHGAGAPFVLMSDAALLALPDAMALQAGTVAGAIDWQARGGDAMQRVTVSAGQQALVPLAPVHGDAARTGSGDAVVRWIARSRAGARWRDGVEVPSGETAPTWQLRWPDAALAMQESEVAAAPVVLAAGSYAPGAVLTVAQRGDFGLSAPLAIRLPA